MQLVGHESAGAGTRRGSVLETAGDVVRVEDRHLGGAAESVGTHHRDVHPRDGADAGAAPGAALTAPIGSSPPRFTTAWPGRKGTEVLGDANGSDTGPPPPCGMQKVLFRW